MTWPDDAFGRRRAMGLRPTRLGYAYQDLFTALRLVDLAVGRANSVPVDRNMFTGDRLPRTATA
ncbi:hypothetical protein [Nonomuraea recticatena]|uniref:Uncharacterized protein n=1 Tax=Nonomuraea recticatena TaxID=46178 RepID=A0ABP6EEI3_9ACTN